MAKKNYDGKDKDDGLIIGAMVFVVMLFLGPVLLALLWSKIGHLATIVFTHLRYLEIALFAILFEGAGRLFSLLGFAIQSNDMMELENFRSMMEQTGYYTRWLFLPVMVGLALFAFLRSPRERYSRRHTMQSLAVQESAIWPEISPVAGKQEELIKADPTKGEWASAMTEREFAAKYKLLTTDRDGRPSIKRDEARQVFASMLGARWTGTKALPAHTKGIFAALAMRIGGDAAGATERFRLMASTFAKGGIQAMDTSWADAEIAKHINHPVVKKCLEKHAYVYTVMATMLQLAKTGGVLASPMFIWVKTVDRKLWYTLNNVGRYAFHVDCAGIMAHWLFEKTVGIATPTPMVDKAVDGLDLALKEYKEDDSFERMFA